MTEYRRIFLYIALAIVAYLLWDNWQKEHPQHPAVASNAQVSAQGGVLPSSLTQLTEKKSAAVIASTPEKLIHVRTDVMDAQIDTHGGNIASIKLPQYPEAVKSSQPITLLNSDPNTLYVAQSGLLGEQGPDTQQAQAQYTAEKNEYILQDGQNELAVVLKWQNSEGVQVSKTFTFKRGKYDIPIDYTINNQSTQVWTGEPYGQMKRKPEQISTSIFSLHTFNGASISTSEKPYEKIAYSKLEDQNLSRQSLGGWLALQQRYFLSAWIPEQNQSNHFYSAYDPSNQVYTVGYLGPQISVAPNTAAHTSAKFYSGPESTDDLKAVAPHLDLTIDYGWLWPISIAIFWVMKHIYNWVGNWGWSIVLVTVLIKLLFYKLSETSYRAMAKMRNLTPRMQALKERYGDDRQKLGQAMMELYRKEKVNPLGGCLPMLVQIPFFIGLYYVLIESVELRHAPFILWIHDLSAKDPYFVLPILMGLSMLLQQRLNPPPPDPIQAKVMMMLPIVFTIFFLAFPSGLVLYWLVNNCLSILQQWYILWRFEKKKASLPHKS